MEGRPADEVSFPLARIVGHGDGARGDGVHANFRRESFRQTFCEHDDSGFRCAVRNIAGPGEEATDVGEIDDYAVRFLQERGGRLRAEKWGLQVSVERRVPKL